MYTKAMERGLSVMPINARTGAAIIEGWQKFSECLPTEEECELWEKRYPIGEIYGIALVLGKASGIEAVDVDTDDPAAHILIPKSIYGKYGLPGRACYFFAWDETHYNIGEGEKKVGLYHTGKYHIIPPSRHRKFDGFYTVMGKNILDIDRDELPRLESLDFFHKLPNATSSEFNKSEGRNSFFVRAITAMRADGKSEEEIVEWIYSWDLKNHNPRLFTDPNEQYRARTESEARSSAHKMVISVTRTLLTKGLQVVLPSQRKSIENLFNIDTFVSRSYPIPASGVLRLFLDAANASSRFDITPIAIGGALSFMSALLSNRVRLNRTWPNTYIVALASSGFGKGAVVDLLKEILSGTNLLGADMYRSSQAFIQSLPDQQMRLDVIDEAAPFFESMKSTTNYTSDLVDVVNRLFSLGPTRYDGISSAKHGKKSGACWNPCVSIYATVHHAGFMKSVQGYLGTSGLMPRFLVFDQGKPKRHVTKLNEQELSLAIEALKSYVAQIASVHPYVKEPAGLLDDNKSCRYFPSTLTYDHKAKLIIDKYEEETGVRMLTNHDSPDSPYVARLHELALKIAMISTMSMKRDYIHVEDVEYAIELVEALFHNSQLIRHTVSNSGKVTGPWAKVESCLMRHGKTSHADLQRLSDIPRRELDPILETMIEAGAVCKEIIPTATRPKRVYYIPQQKLQ